MRLIVYWLLGAKFKKSVRNPHNSALILLQMRLSALLCSAAAVAAAPPRVGLYVGGGATGPSFINYTIAFQSLNIPYVTLNSTDVDAGLKGFDVFLMPGGMSTTESIDVGNLGLSNILQFVAEGGGYIGVCAGAYLAMTAECCDKRVTGYCNNQTGCYKTPWSLGMVNAGTTNPWDRGHGYVNISFTDAAVDMLKLPASYRSANKTIMYWCVAGSIRDRKLTLSAALLSENRLVTSSASYIPIFFAIRNSFVQARADS